MINHRKNGNKETAVARARPRRCFGPPLAAPPAGSGGPRGNDGKGTRRRSGSRGKAKTHATHPLLVPADEIQGATPLLSPTDQTQGQGVDRQGRAGAGPVAGGAAPWPRAQRARPAGVQSAGGAACRGAAAGGTEHAVDAEHETTQHPRRRSGRGKGFLAVARQCPRRRVLGLGCSVESNYQWVGTVLGPHGKWEAGVQRERLSSAAAATAVFEPHSDLAVLRSPSVS